MAGSVLPDGFRCVVCFNRLAQLNRLAGSVLSAGWVSPNRWLTPTHWLSGIRLLAPFRQSIGWFNLCFGSICHCEPQYKAMPQQQAELKCENKATVRVPGADSFRNHLLENELAPA